MIHDLLPSEIRTFLRLVLVLLVALLIAFDDAEVGGGVLMGAFASWLVRR